MKRLKFISFAAILMLLAAPTALAQMFPSGDHGIGDGYGPNRDETYPQEIQTTNSPAGTAVEPGSQLLYLLNTGVDARGFPTGSTLRERGITGPAFQNFISITNSNPTDAVTVHFRYFSETCVDVLDFLVILTCNDTMLIDPFDYTIPGSTSNVSQRFYGVEGGFPVPITKEIYGGGRFLLMVTASGAVGNDSGAAGDTSPAGDRGDFDDPEDLDKFADWLFPFRLFSASILDHCWAVNPNTVGRNPGSGTSVNDNNLNVFNASAISFNYLTGFHTLAVARAEGLAAHGVTAWTRPAVNLSFNDLDAADTSEVPDQVPDFSPQDVVGAAPTAMVWDPSKQPNGIFDFFDLYNIIDAGLDGDGPLAPKRCVLAGSEEIWLTLTRNAALVLPANYFYLRQDAHGGDSVETNCEGTTPDSLRCDSSNPFFQTPSLGGALGWTIFPESGVAPEDQYLYGLSVKDDYNGSGNPNNSLISATTDSAYRLDAAATYYELAIYNNDEELLDIPIEIEDISPPPTFTPLVTRVALRCIDYFTFGNFVIPSSQRVLGGAATDFVFTANLKTFSVQDLYNLAPETIRPFLIEPVNVNDELGPGWIRFNRILTRDYWYDATLTGSILGFSEPYDGERGTYVTIAKSEIFQAAFGVAWYLPQAATEFDPNN